VPSEQIQYTSRLVSVTITPLVMKTFVSIDLGTSAIVAAVMNERANSFSFKFLNLQKRLKELRAELTPGAEKETQLEEDTPFIASDVLLQDGKRLDGTDLKSSSLNLSPPLTVLVNNESTWLPNIKMLFGQGGVAKLKNTFGDYFTYSVGNDQNIKIPADDEKVIEKVLHALVHLTLEGFVRPQREVRQFPHNLLEVVFTVPNNFNKHYREVIQQWAYRPRSDNHPGINVHFVSESDAVAYTYLDFWESLHPGKDRNKKEIILTYDIGAGTLDMSLIRRRLNPNDKKEQQFHVMGRVGLPKAGNYLDYLLAKIIWEMHGPSGEHEQFFVDFKPFAKGSTANRLETLAYKNWIRNEVKPALAKLTKEEWEKKNKFLPIPKNLEVTIDDEQKKYLNLTDILLNIQFLLHLKDITTLALEKICKNAFTGEDPPAIDTILFSGRMVQFNRLRAEVLNAVKRLPNQKGHKVKEIYADQWDLKGLTDDSAKLKGLVALGGLRYLSKYRFKTQGGYRIIHGEPKLNAAYGLFFNRSASTIPDYKYVELIHPAEKIDYDERQTTEGIKFGNARFIYLIQTYEHDEKVIEKSFANNKFTGDFTVNILDDGPIYLGEYNLSADQITRADISLSATEGMLLRLHAKNDSVIERTIINYRRGYNAKSLEANYSQWPFNIS